MAEKWNLPLSLINVIRHHHKPINLPPNLSPNEAKLITIVHLADALTRMIGTGVGSDGLMYSLDVPALEKAGMDVKKNNYLEILIAELVDLRPVIKSLAESFMGQDV